MNTTRFVSVALATFLQFAPLLSRVTPSLPALSRSPAAILFQWIAGALAVAGSYHTVSAATAVVQSPTFVSGTVGTRLSHQIRINDGKNRQPGSWLINGTAFSSSGSTSVGLPPGLSMALNTAIISGTPTAAGVYPVRITAYEHSSLRGAKLAFTLTFTITGGSQPPSITGPPSGGSITEGNPFTFSVTATGTAPLAYQWFHQSVAIPGATSSSLVLPAAKVSDSGSYHVTVTNDAGTASSDDVVLSVEPRLVATQIDTDLPDGSIHPGETITLSVAASGTPPLAFQWFHNGGALRGATEATLKLPDAAGILSGSFAVQVSGPGGSVRSRTATIGIVPLRLSTPSISSASASMLLATVPGRTYVLEASSGSISDGWAPISEVTATGPETRLTQAILPDGVTFWRYRTAP